MVSIALVGLARNCEPLIDQLTIATAAWQQEFDQVRVVIGENGSSDATREKILANGFELVDTSIDGQIIDRYTRMSAMRETVRLHLLQEPPPDLVVVSDLDGSFARAVDSGQLRTIYQRLCDDPSVFAYSAWSRPYFDLVAYEDDEVSLAYVWREIRPHPSDPLRLYMRIRKSIYARQKYYASRGSALCISAFNGLCVYRGADYARASYAMPPGQSLCEHTIFNRQLAQDGRRMMIMRELEVPTVVEHTDRGLVRFSMQWFRDQRALRLKNR